MHGNRLDTVYVGGEKLYTSTSLQTHCHNVIHLHFKIVTSDLVGKLLRINPS